MSRIQPPLAWIEPGQAFPPLALAWGPDSPAPGLLAAGGQLDTPTLLAAYSQGVFPWFSQDQPVLWWSPDPRMVLQVDHWRLHRSLRRVLERFRRDPVCQIRIDSDFSAVIRRCAGIERPSQSGTWIVPEMIGAYERLHAAGHAHSVETWIGGRLVAGLYCVAIGRSVFGESMFTTVTDGSKIALAGLVAFCRSQGIARIDCQQNTRHLASFGAAEMPRSDFIADVARTAREPSPIWCFDPVYWDELFPPRPNVP
jgi:leucyl/phenylalanyl-tRNA---protein transferase